MKLPEKKEEECFKIGEDWCLGFNFAIDEVRKMNPPIDPLSLRFKGIDVNTREWVEGYYIKRNCDGHANHYIYRSYYDELEISEYCNSCDCMEPKDLKDLFIKVHPETVELVIGCE